MKATIVSLLLAWLASTAFAHPGHVESPPGLMAQAGSPARKPAMSAGSQVSVVTNGAFRIITANGLPDHAPGQFPNRGNPNAISAQSYSFRLTLNPQTNATLQSSQGAWFGVALNGVPFEPGTAEFWNGQREWNYEAQGGFIDLGLDANNAHVQPNGAYHYHGLPTGLMQKTGDGGKQMLLLGYAADGFPIYTSFGHSNATNAVSSLMKLRSSWQLRKGTRPGGPGGTYDGRFTADYEFVAGNGDLDECNGRYGVTPEYPRGIYHYCVTEEFPQIARSWRGTPDPSFFKRGAGPRGPGERRPPPRIPGAPPPPPRG